LAMTSRRRLNSLWGEWESGRKGGWSSEVDSLERVEERWSESRYKEVRVW
jgi:hypothetical protein